MVGLTNGVTIGVLLAGIAGVWFGLPKLSLVIGLAVTLNLIAASLAGTLIPLALDRLDRDPAVASPVFVTWITDTVGFFTFLGLAGLIVL
jgi:magnesium transporter